VKNSAGRGWEGELKKWWAYALSFVSYWSLFKKKQNKEQNSRAVGRVNAKQNGNSRYLYNYIAGVSENTG